MILPISEFAYKVEPLVDRIYRSASVDPLDENTLREKLRIQGHKTTVQVDDPDLFHRIAQSEERGELNRLGGLNFILDVRRDGVIDHWTVCLPDHLREEFM
ncbi:hypothetical protein JW826_00400 [Candidatus Woesearchaeota archaeon]|nr:hypothetical protein [Candidatus Woesearchaeota archaeon]